MRYRVLTGINYLGRDGEIRREPGEIVDDVPEASLPWLLEQGHVEEVAPKPASKPSRTA